MRHSKTIDGLRAVAVVSVLFGHTFHERVSGGFVGVDIFFVISGFLITILLVRQAQSEQFSLIEFYKRRILRLLPALLVVTVVTCLLSLVILPPYMLRELGQALAATSVFVSNILFWMKSGYFDSAAEVNPLVHTWSLGVEEQFYLAAPILVLLARRSTRSLTATLVAITLASLAFAYSVSRVVPSTWFFFTLNRVFELALGSLTGVVYLKDRGGQGFDIATHAPLSVNLVAVASLTAILWSIFAFGPHTHHPGLITLVPTLAAGTLLYLHDRGTWVGRLLSLRPLVGIGLISYSLYLWHQPLLAIFRVQQIERPSKVALVGVLVASGALAWATWRYVETPFRRYDQFSTRRTLIGAALMLSGSFAVGATFHLTDGMRMRYPDELHQKVEGNSRTAGWKSDREVLLWGDSHAQMLFPAFRQGTSTRKLHLGGCPPILGFDNDWRNLNGETCSEFNERSLKEATRLPRGSVVILIARWSQYIEPPYQADEHGFVSSLTSRSIFPSTQDQWRPFDIEKELGASLRKSVSAMTRTGLRVLLVGPVAVQQHHAHNLAYLVRGNDDALMKYSATRTDHDRGNALMNAVLESVAREFEGAFYFDPATLLCGQERCPLVLQGQVAYADTNHLNGFGASLLAEALVNQPAFADSLATAVPVSDDRKAGRGP